MVQVYVNLIKLGFKTVEDVPEKYKQAVIDALNN